MAFLFTGKREENREANCPVISGPKSLELSGVEYLVVTEQEGPAQTFEIRFDCHFSPFKQALLVGGVLAVGHEEHFYLYSLPEKRNILVLKMDGYFGSFVHHEGCFYVADAVGIHCLAADGALRWLSPPLGVDGVIMHDITDQHIRGSGEWDPPGGWEDFLVDRHTGALLD